MTKNSLNELDGKEWVKTTKSVWIDSENCKHFQSVEQMIETGILISSAPPREKLKKLHPATFSENDIKKLVNFFTKPGETVLDPFLGTGTTAVVCSELNRKCIGIELYEKWYEIAKQRVGMSTDDIKINLGDALTYLQKMENDSIDFIVTSPPYWNVLSKIDHKAKRERQQFGLSTDYGQNPKDISLIGTYEEFLDMLYRYFVEFYRILRKSKYVTIIVSDFRHKQKYYMFHADVAQKLEYTGFTLQGLVTLVQDNKKLYPYGFPTTFVPNICNQFIVIVRKVG